MCHVSCMRMYCAPARSYEADAMYFDHDVRDAKYKDLSAKLWDVVNPAVSDQVRLFVCFHVLGCSVCMSAVCNGETWVAQA